jgi:hypothetical protein
LNRRSSERNESELKTYDNFVAEHEVQHVTTMPSGAAYGGDNSAVPSTGHLDRVHTMCEDLINVLEEQLRDINAGGSVDRRNDDIRGRRCIPATSASAHKETSLSGRLLYSLNLGYPSS